MFVKNLNNNQMIIFNNKIIIFKPIKMKFKHKMINKFIINNKKINQFKKNQNKKIFNKIKKLKIL